MKKTISGVVSVLFSLSLAAVTIDNVTVRQDWPWSPRVDVSYHLSDVTSPVDIRVELFDGAVSLGTVTPSGDCYALLKTGDYSLSFDPTTLGLVHQLAVGQFKVKLTPVASDPSWLFPLYKDIDLETGAVTDITPQMILSGELGDWKWVDETAENIVDGKVAYNNLIWTGLAANGTKYKTSHLVLRYLAAKDDVAYLCNATQITLPRDLYFAVFETTQGQWTKVYGSAPSCNWAGETLPVEKVKFNDIRGAKGTEEGTEAQYLWPNAPDPDSFLGKLRAKCGLTAIDLPAEYEWTYAAMGKSGFCSGSLSSASFTWNDNVPWNDRTVPPGRQSQTGEVGSYAPPSTMGLYDLHGNVSEFCIDYGFGTQKELKDLKTTPNVNLENPTQKADGTAYSSRAYAGADYSTIKDQSTLNTLTVNKMLAPDNVSEKVGFRVCMPAGEVEMTVPAALTDVTSGESAPTSVFMRASESFLWRTAPGATFTVSWTLPAGATKATLTVAGRNYLREYADLTATSQELTLPTADENVYTLTLAFDKGEPKTAKLAWVKSAADGATATTAYAPEGTRKWHRAAAWNVLPIPFGATALAVDGEPVETDLDGAAGWYGLDFAGADAKTVKLTVGDVDYENALTLPSGILLLVR